MKPVALTILIAWGVISGGIARAELPEVLWSKNAAVVSPVFSPDGQIAATSDARCPDCAADVHLWRVQGWKLLQTLPEAGGVDGFAADGATHYTVVRHHVGQAIPIYHNGYQICHSSTFQNSVTLMSWRVSDGKLMSSHSFDPSTVSESRCEGTATLNRESHGSGIAFSPPTIVTPCFR